MSNSTIPLQTILDWTGPFLNYLPLALGPGNQPAISTANLVMQTIVNPPFRWRWNRQLSSATLLPGVQDFSTDPPSTNLNFLEGASVTNARGNTFQIQEVQMYLNRGSEQARPNRISPLVTDTNGLTSFRVLPIADATYVVSLAYQVRPPLFLSLTQTLYPIPDEYSFVFMHGFMAYSMLYADDPRWTVELSRFLASLIGISEGLDETQKNIFLDSWLNPRLMAQRLELLTRQGISGQGSPTAGER